MRVKVLKFMSYVLSVVGAYCIGFHYADMICGMHHRGFSASPELALYVYGAQFGLAVLACWIAIWALKRKENKENEK